VSAYEAALRDTPAATPLDVDRLAAVAEAARETDWRAWYSAWLDGDQRPPTDIDYIAAASPETVLALIAVARAAENLRAHILGGLESQTHLPGDLCVKQLDAALAALEVRHDQHAARHP
jgi:hypothetical protein